jgi:hypothetical protein
VTSSLRRETPSKTEACGGNGKVGAAAQPHAEPRSAAGKLQNLHKQHKHKHN